MAIPRDSQAWLIHSVLPIGGTVLIYGDAKQGKSYLALQMALAVVAGGEWMGFPVERTGRALYVQLDTPSNLWAADGEQYLKRLADLGHPMHPDLFFTDRETLGTWPFNITDPEHWARLRACVSDLSPEVVFIDTFREAHRGDENASDDMQHVVAALVSATRPAALVLVHHSKKPNPEHGRDSRNDMRGGYIAGRMDTVFQLGKATLSYFGRALPDDSMKIERQNDTGFWLPVHDSLAESVQAIYAAEPNLPIREAARRLAESTGRSEESCRSLIRRHRPG